MKTTNINESATRSSSTINESATCASSTETTMDQRKDATKTAPPVKLDAPGKGLPFLEGLVLRYWIFPRNSKKKSWEKNAQLFKREGEKILDLSKNLTESELTKKVLISHIPGIEDSSRFWSVAETMEHLMIVGAGMAHFIDLLSHGKKPDIKADPAMVKPVGKGLGMDVRRAYEKFMQTHLEQIEKNVGDKNSPQTHFHPWMGEMNAHQWFWLMASHQIIHRMQIEKILKGL